MVPITILATILMTGFPQISQTIYTPSLPAITSALHTTGNLTQWTLSIYFIGFALGVLIWGTLSDHFGRRPCMLWGLLIYTLASFACMFALHIYYLFACMFVQALGASVGSVITMTMVRDSYTQTKSRNHLFAIVGAALAFAPAIGPLLGGYLVELLGWQSNFALLSIMGLVLLIYAFKCLPETHQSLGQKHVEHHIGRLLLKMLSDKRVMGFAFLIAAFNGILFSYYAQAPFLFIELLHLSPGDYGLTGVVIAVASWLGSRSSMKLNKSLSTERVILLSIIITIIGAGLLFMASLLGLVASARPALGIICILTSMFFVFIGFGMGIPNCLSIALVDYKHVLGSAGSIFGLFYYILIALFTAIMGLIHSATAWPMPAYFTLLGIAMLSTYLLVIRK